jgi:hypothetical protein
MRAGSPSREIDNAPVAKAELPLPILLSNPAAACGSGRVVRGYLDRVDTYKEGWIPKKKTAQTWLQHMRMVPCLETSNIIKGKTKHIRFYLTHEGPQFLVPLAQVTC